MNDYKIFDTAVTILVVLLVWEGLRWGLNFGLKKLTGNEYMLRRDCEANHSDDDKSVDDIRKELSVIREILLLVAIKAGVSPDEYRKLAR